MQEPAPAARWTSLIVALVAIVHRGAVFCTYHHDLDLLVAANPDWWSMQNPPLPSLQTHLAATLLVMQQTPPISVLIVGTFAKLVSWPYIGADALIAFNTVVSVATVVLFHRLLLVCLPGRVVVPTVIAAAFALSADLLVLEYNSFGQTLYENLAMLLVVALAFAILRVRTTAPPRAAAVAGTIAGVLILTRASWSFVAVPGVVLVVALAGRSRGRAAVAFLLPLLVLQGTWAVKNWAIYGRFSLSPSSWVGYNLTNGIAQIGYGKEFQILQFRRAAAALANPEAAVASLGPADYAAQDRELFERFGVEQWPTNSPQTADMWEGLRRDFIAFARIRPDVVLLKALRSYEIFWQPIANYGRLYVALFAPMAPAPSGLDLRQTLVDLSRGALPQQMGVTAGKKDPAPPTVRPVPTWTSIAVDPFRLAATIVGVHLLAPLAGLGWILRRLRRSTLPEPDATKAAALAVCGLLYTYLAAVSSFGEFGENMRFRLAVEPLIWTLTVLGAVGCWRLLSGVRAKRPRGR